MSTTITARTPCMYRAGALRSGAAALPGANGARAVDYRESLRQHLGAVGDAVRFVAARHRLSSDMTEELNSRALLHLVDHDYAVLRQWRRECSLHTYLTTVITRVFLDLRNQEWGKAKAPAIAKRLGAVALMLWRLTHRARLTFDEAVTALWTEHGVAATRDELWDMFSRLPAPSSRYFVDVNELAGMEQPGADAEVLVHQVEHRRLAARVDRGLAHALDGLGGEDRLILKLYFHDGMSLAGVARLLNLDQPRLYPHFHGLLARLRASLEAQGVAAADVAEVVGEPEPFTTRRVLASGAESARGVGRAWRCMPGSTARHATANYDYAAAV